MQASGNLGPGTTDLRGAGALQLAGVLTDCPDAVAPRDARSMGREAAADLRLLPADYRFYLSIAGLTVGVTSDEPLDLQVSGASTRFLVPCGMPDVRLNVATADLSDEPPPGECLFDSGALWKLHRDGDGDGLLFRFTSPAFGPLPYRMARFTRDFSRGEVVIHRPYLRPGPVNPIEYPLDEIVFTNLLSRGLGVEIHACGLVDRSGSGYLFAGQSGAGKTTTARLWTGLDGVRILSDDRIVLRPESDGIWMHGTPWHGDEPLAAPLRVPLTRVLLLQQGGPHRIVPLGRVQAVARLFSCAFVPFHEREALASIVEMLDRITRTVPTDDFWFANDRTAVDFLRAQS